MKTAEQTPSFQEIMQIYAYISLKLRHRPGQECVCLEHGKYNYQHCDLEGFQNRSPSWRQMPQATEFNKTVLTQSLQH